jgi:hypothetical protein
MKNWLATMFAAGFALSLIAFFYDWKPAVSGLLSFYVLERIASLFSKELDVRTVRQLAEKLPVPVIASGGGGTMQHFVDVFKKGRADAALAASIFHFKEIRIGELKEYLKSKDIIVRL